MPLRAGRIHDPVHAYVGFTRMERAFLDDPDTRRVPATTVMAIGGVR